MNFKQLLFLLLLFVPHLVQATDETTAVATCGKSFIISGDVHHATPDAGTVVIGDPGDNTFKEEIFGSEFTATVAGLPLDVYTVKIILAETWAKYAGARVMRIKSKDAILADQFDIYQVAGGYARLYILQKTINHQGDALSGPLSITFTALVNNAKFNAIRIFNSLGIEVACVKACDLIPLADAEASQIQVVTDSIIYNDITKPIDDRINDLIRRMSLIEKSLELRSDAPGVERLSLPPYNYWNEALHGVALAGNATVFPQPVGLAATWNDDYVYLMADAIAVEARAKYCDRLPSGAHGISSGLNFWLPNLNVFRDPRWGRGQETYGEDPYLISRIGVSYIKGLQGNDPKYYKAMACAKHFAIHSGPEAGRSQLNVTPLVARDLYETYLPQFEAAVKDGKVYGFMASYNAIDGVPNACNPWLLTDLLRNKWGFEGYVVSDCSAVDWISDAHHYAIDHAAGAALALKAGLNMECGGAFFDLPKSVKSGLITVNDINAALLVNLRIRFKLGLFDPQSQVPLGNAKMSEVESPSHLALSTDLARQSMVLLKNNGILPLNKNIVKRIAVIGPNADDAVMQYGNYCGSSAYPITILQGIKNAVGTSVIVQYVKGCPIVAKPTDIATDITSQLNNAVSAAQAADVVIFVSGINSTLESEESSTELDGFYHGDRTKIELPAIQETTLRAIQATGKPIVLVNCSGSAMAIPWEKENIPAILQAWYPVKEGQQLQM